MADYLFVTVLTVSILIQIAAAVLAVRSVTYTPRKGPWICITAGIVLMAVRRIITLVGVVATWETPQSVSWGAEITALVISILMVSGIFLLYQSLRELAGTMSDQQKLFRESLHASKNHFQSLASLLHTEASYATNERQRSFATEIEQRVSAYAILQQQLFDHDYEVDIHRYLEDLSVTIEDAYAVAGRHTVVTRELSSFPVTPKETLYAGLVVSEAMINAYKYAGEGPLKLAIVAGLGSDSSRRVVEVRDNGPGFPADVLSGDRAGFGTTFLRSLNGTRWRVALSNKDGAVVRAEF